MRAAVIVFPGSNAEVEMCRALTLAGASARTVWHREPNLPPDTELVALPGGFAHGDYLRCGAVARTSPVIAAVRAHAARGGLVLGVCNGFQVLTEAGLLPGALVANAHLRFECSDRWVTVEAEGPFTPRAGVRLRLPVAHGEGRYHVDAEALARLRSEGRVALTYRLASGASPDEFNGSLDAIAGVYGGPSKNVLGMMPHPERAAEPYVGNTDGRSIFDAAVEWCASRQSRACA
ncbi:MAG: phosphoribosylformylglycinamidine synthase subunit PurQ [Polyangiaceae bacterium]|nr:phosphoribosylformylglycinamidine synthase subunit PurQ [Polyangiaceae bacterium]